MSVMIDLSLNSMCLTHVSNSKYKRDRRTHRLHEANASYESYHTFLQPEKLDMIHIINIFRPSDTLREVEIVLSDLKYLKYQVVVSG